jgi:hypothetical protein
MHKPSPHLVTNFLTYLFLYETYFLHENVLFLSFVSFLSFKKIKSYSQENFEYIFH